MKRKERTSTSSMFSFGKVSRVSGDIRQRSRRGKYRFSILEVEDEHCPHLSVHFLEDKCETILRDLNSPPSCFDESTLLQQMLHARAELDAVIGKIYSRAANHVAKHSLPLPPRELVQFWNRDMIVV